MIILNSWVLRNSTVLHLLRKNSVSLVDNYIEYSQINMREAVYYTGLHDLCEVQKAYFAYTGQAHF